MARRMEQGCKVSSFHIRAAALVIAAGCSSTAASPPVEHAPAIASPQSDGTVRLEPGSRMYVATTRVVVGAETPLVRAPARLAFRDGAVSQITLPVAGRVTEVHVKTGDKVTAGMPLLTVSSPEAAAARAAAAGARAEHDVAVSELARQDKMAASGVGIDSERAAVAARVRQTEVELARAQTTAALLGGGGGSTVVLSSPIDGTVISRRANVGTIAQPGGEPLIELGNPSALWVIADVFERDVAQVHEGAAVAISLSSRAQPVAGHVVSVGTALTGSLRTAPVYIALDADGDQGVRAGMFARAAISLPSAEAIVLPAEAILVKDGKTTLVYVKRGESVFTPRPVEVGPSIDGKVQVLSGLTVGEEVVTKGALLLDGAAEQLL